ncbi:MULTISPECIES: type IV pilus biogenesis/stability protein PilW [unclassified Pantoea]|uniref:type IV pilus biogenesis/stability protein PilW n=1 Tax=unclassified Pantoea TaxID=2630326 RepID=UPI001CD40D1E|nr:MULTISPECIES: type IV pilus biogenesis/stability protein PilW [unclassified Pantoea]MCA1175859.1 type IV pilus biogenesis/stability protein PilW [Pantoea sp. alder69]MCA1250691.1 type IV pilus biogenesis/stability protein PilW [Pantoea sp. alder70]MCA1265095.1 type IV pilus biogenesis/stability protein PilW [Pantoea sp. alder81]
MHKGLSAVLLAVFVVTGCVNSPAQQGAADIRLQLGLHYLAVKDFEAAQRNLLRAERAAPRDYRVPLALARLAQAQQNSAQTHWHYQRAQQLAPANGYIANNYGAFLCGLRQYGEAHQQFKLAMAAQEIEARQDAFLFSGYCYLQAGESASARESLSNALIAAPEQGSQLLTEVEKRLKQQDRLAVPLLLEVYHQRLPATAESQWLQIRFAAQQGNAADVIRYGDRLARSFPQSIQYQRYLANEY